MNGSCADNKNIDKSVAQKKLSLVQEMPAGYKLMLFAVDCFYDETGQRVIENQSFIFQILTCKM